MKSTLTLTSCLALLAGCAATTDSYCDIASPILFDTQRTIEWLARNDLGLLTDVIVHNEQVSGLCGKRSGL